MKNILIVLGVLIFISGCADKVKFSVLKPSKVDDKDIRQISIIKPKNDKYSLANKVTIAISKVKFDNKPYFQIVERDKLAMVMKEKIFNDSKITELDDSSVVMSAAKVFLFINPSTMKHNEKITYKPISYKNRCTRYNSNKKCIEYGYKNIRCKNATYILDADIKIVKISTSKIIYANSYQSKKSKKVCGSYFNPASFYDLFGNELSYKISDLIMKDLSPHYEKSSIELLNDTDIDYTSKQKTLLESGIELLKNNNIKEAKAKLQKLVRLTVGRSFVAQYNLGVSYEVMGELENAQKRYSMANNLTEKPNKVISSALKRIDIRINENRRTKSQLN
jgi:tetratricopeptide (TPR) repeat protein